MKRYITIHGLMLGTTVGVIGLLLQLLLLPLAEVYPVISYVYFLYYFIFGSIPGFFVNIVVDIPYTLFGVLPGMYVYYVALIICICIFWIFAFSFLDRWLRKRKGA